MRSTARAPERARYRRAARPAGRGARSGRLRLRRRAQVRRARAVLRGAWQQVLAHPGASGPHPAAALTGRVPPAARLRDRPDRSGEAPIGRGSGDRLSRRRPARAGGQARATPAPHPVFQRQARGLRVLRPPEGRLRPPGGSCGRHAALRRAVDQRRRERLLGPAALAAARRAGPRGSSRSRSNPCHTSAAYGGAGSYCITRCTFRACVTS